MRISIELNRGLTGVLLTPVATATNPSNPAMIASQRLLIVSSLTLAARYEPAGVNEAHTPLQRLGCPMPTVAG